MWQYFLCNFTYQVDLVSLVSFFGVFQGASNTFQSYLEIKETSLEFNMEILQKISKRVLNSLSYSIIDHSETVLIHLTKVTVSKESESCSVVSNSLRLHGLYRILEARILEWVAVPFSRGSSQSRDWTEISHVTGRFFFFYCLSHQGSPRWQWNISKANTEQIA